MLFARSLRPPAAWSRPGPVGPRRPRSTPRGQMIGGAPLRLLHVQVVRCHQRQVGLLVVPGQRRGDGQRRQQAVLEADPAQPTQQRDRLPGLRGRGQRVPALAHRPGEVPEEVGAGLAAAVGQALFVLLPGQLAGRVEAPGVGEVLAVGEQVEPRVPVARLALGWPRRTRGRRPPAPRRCGPAAPARRRRPGAARPRCAGRLASSWPSADSAAGPGPSGSAPTRSAARRLGRQRRIGDLRLGLLGHP